jgi:hypothetical protein
VPVVNEREKEIETKHRSILERAASLVDKETKRIVVRTLEESTTASVLIHDAADWQAIWKEDPTNYGTKATPGEIPRLHKAHAARVEAWRKLDTPLQRVVDGCNLAVGAWIREEQRKRDAAAAKLETKERRNEPAFVAPREKVQVTGIITVERWEAQVFYCLGDECRCKLQPADNESEEKGQREEAIANLHYTQGLWALVQAVAKKKADLAYVTENQKLLDDLAREKHDMADKDGYILPGVRCVRLEGTRRG